MGLTHSWRGFLRELKSGELTVLLLALTVGVGAISAVGLATDRVSQVVERRASESLAADLVVRSSERIPDEYEALAREAGLASARTLEFPSVISAGDAGQLVELQAVTGGYPLRGRIRLSDRPFVPGEAVERIPPAGEIWLESRVFAALDIRPGDTVTVGRTELRAGAVLDYRPDQGFEFADLAPAVLLNMQDIPATGLVGPASRVRHRLLLAGERDALAGVREQLQGRLQPRERLRGIRDGDGRLTRTLGRADRFLGLAALVAMLLAAVAVAMAARRYCARQTGTAAVLKCLGASRRTVNRLHVLHLLWTGLAGAAAGVAVGYAAQAGLIALLGGWLPAELPPPGVTPALGAGGMGLLVLGGFGLPPVLRLGKTPPLRVLRRELGPPALPAVAVGAAGLVSLVGLLIWLTGDMVLSAYVLGGTAGGVVLLGAGAWLLVRALAPLRGRIGTAGRFGVANIARRGPESIAQIVAFGVGVLVLLLLIVVRGDLLAQWRATLPEDAPNHFFINIQPDQREGVRRFFERRDMGRPVLYPMVRARLVEINGKPAGEHPFAEPERGRWFVEREQNLSWSERLPAGNTVVAGRFWNGVPDGPQVSLEEEVAHNLGLGIGDTLTFDLAGERITAPVTSLRAIKWDSFHPNFFVVFPPGALEAFPATWITSVHVPRAKAPELVQLVREYPSVTVIDVGSLLEQIRAVMDQAALALEYVFVFTLAAGLVVLMAAVQSTREARRFESALMRTLGASRRRVFAAVAVEFTLLGLLAGMLASIAASVTGWLLATQVFEFEWRFQPLLWIVAVPGTMLLVGAAGWLATRRAVSQPPLIVLRRQ